MPPKSKPAPARPGYYIAQADVFTEPVADRMPVRAFRAGDHVPPDLYDAHPEWQPLLAAADDAEAASAAEDDQAPRSGGADSAGTDQGS